MCLCALGRQPVVMSMLNSIKLMREIMPYGAVPVHTPRTLSERAHILGEQDNDHITLSGSAMRIVFHCTKVNKNENMW